MPPFSPVNSVKHVCHTVKPRPTKSPRRKSRKRLGSKPSRRAVCQRSMIPFKDPNCVSRLQRFSKRPDGTTGFKFCRTKPARKSMASVTKLSHISIDTEDIDEEALACSIQAATLSSRRTAIPVLHVEENATTATSLTITTPLLGSSEVPVVSVHPLPLTLSPAEEINSPERNVIEQETEPSKSAHDEDALVVLNLIEEHCALPLLEPFYQEDVAFSDMEEETVFDDDNGMIDVLIKQPVIPAKEDQNLPFLKVLIALIAVILLCTSTVASSSVPMAVIGVSALSMLVLYRAAHSHGTSANYVMVGGP